ncbi:MAG: replication factor C large subunit [Harvfovirus sp.]|uniref:Replication factor C large subunit n=1 Tax=Harvfovirus sp. TaxID=2487768 RepID=A0A3G5A4S9_9VIRU|nr:MAG: replication factor C large subunit [Harvfovirus sp.]
MEYFESNGNNSDPGSWTEKYCPKAIGEIIGNDKAVKGVVAWLNSFEENKKKMLSKPNKNRKKPKIKIPVGGGGETGMGEVEVEAEIDMDSITEFDRYCADEDNVDPKPKSGKAHQPKSCMIITGNHGVGKTCVVNAVLKTMGYCIQIVNFGKIKTNKNIKEIIENIMNSSDILNMLNGKKNTKIAIVIDELEAITSTMSKNCIMALLKNNDDNWLYPTIFISNNQHNKLLSDIKKNSYEIRMWPPYQSELLTLLKRIVKEENISISGVANSNYKVAYNIIDHAQKDYRRLILTLNDLKYAYENKSITLTMVNEYCKLSNKKDEDFDLFRATNFLLQKYNGIEDCIRYYETEKVLLPLMVHQNYIDMINLKIGGEEGDLGKKNEALKFQLAEEISYMLSEGDVIENYIYGEQNWDINEVHGYLTCAVPSYLLCRSLPEDDSIKLVFPADLNKASIGKINKKNIINAGKCFKNKNIHDYIYINLIIRNLIGESRIDDCVKLLEGYDVKLVNIESLLKVDKIKSSKTNLTSKQKKELLFYLDEE